MSFSKLCCALSALALSVSVAAQDSSQGAGEDVQSAETVLPPPQAPLVISPPAPPASEAVPAPPIASRKSIRPVTDFVGTEEKLNWFQSPAIFLPSELEPGEGQIFERETMFTVPLAWAVAGKLASDVSIKVDGKGIDLSAGTILPQVVLKKPNGLVDQRYRLYCTRSRTVQQAKKDMITHIFGPLANSLRDAQWCLQDTDDDGLLDMAVVLNAGAAVTKADDIEPVAIEQVYGEKIEGDGDSLSFRLEHVGKKTVALYLDIKQEGSSLKFSTLTSGKHRISSYSRYTLREGPQNFITLLGIEFQIVNKNKRENWAQVKWKATEAGKRDFVVIPTKLTTTYF